ncbi:hypothetical protein L3X38_033885 [Prunus dulcis]|uniref:Uncharacterized protein n=1 Tax=Prunus dulcis TaxID=3755 RepID=A0AAD4VJ73_PRUDU|nr:hypothetical protein L3X38_033885 [Prunus dulcis]
MPRYPATSSSKGSHSLYLTFHVLTQLLACQLGGRGNALRLPLKLECSVTITQKLTSSQPKSYFLTANLRDYCLPSIKATSTKAATPSSLPKEDTLPREQYPSKKGNYFLTFTVTLPKLPLIADLSIGESSASTTPVSEA